MKRVFLFSIIILYCNVSYNQIAVIQKDLGEMFFEIPLNATKFDVRKALNQSEIITEVKDLDIPDRKYSVISANFLKNYKLGHIDGTKSMSVYYYFGIEKSDPFYRSLTFMWSINSYNQEKSDRLLKEIMDLFSNSCKKTEKPYLDYNSKVIGKQYFLYTTGEMLKLTKPFLDIKYFNDETLITLLVGVNNLNIE